ncbi:energy-coupling factor transporter transmembrane protein EcfT [Actibacterium sp. MT2.3-13A]|uniref:energy-coupling factor transporter transmembrane component T family protein n=1 Tax=Actibacterium sp. MT2.3-13A TaxID=2828332 RepID=UPI001BA77BC7|nr:energy-coupling factor transporter transmembrane protein EcfT [Actibacterium sp. MT2.3-13A]
MLALTSPVDTVFHRLPAALKLLVMAGFTVAVFRVERPAVMLIPLAIVAAAYAIAGRAVLRQGARALRPLWPFVAVILLWHGATRDLATGLALTGRILSAVALANLVTMTTRLDEMIGVVNGALRPLERLGVRTGAVGFAIALVIRFTPVLIEKGRALAEAWRARSPRRPGWNIVIPVTLAALDDAEYVAEALRARGGLPAGATERNRHGT